MKIRWTRLAMQDLRALRAYISEDDPSAAQKVALTITQTVNLLLPENPEMGRPGRIPTTRELIIPHTPFIIPYRVHANVIEVLRVYHAARRWPDSL